MATAETRASSQPLKVEYPNLRSRLLLHGLFQRQFIVPGEPPRLLEGLLLFIERYLMRIDLTGIDIDRPIFLLGLPRSGTTMLQDICCTHPEVAYITNAMHQFPRCLCAVEVMRKLLRLDAKGERYLADSVEVEAGSPNEGIKLWGTWFGWTPHDLRYVPRTPDSFTPAEIAEIRHQLRRIIWCHGRDRRFFTKNPALIPDIAILQHIFPDAKYIHIVRDPRNSANSMLKLYQLEKQQLDRIRSNHRHGLYDRGVFIPYPRIPKLAEYIEQWGPDDLRTTAHVWNDSVSMIRGWRDKLPHFLEVRYEDILREPEQQLSRLFDFAELRPIQREDARFWNKIAKVGKIHHAHTNQYGNFELVEEICRDHMQTLGYS
ncbi:MAG: sulfotransferase [Planctomycetaceae bacterium]|nr:sulfotransferase [Planctomycetaceae bacterium]